jgi:alpha-mannosidase
MLARTVAGVLDALEAENGYRHFCLDGQAIVLEDHLAVRPQDEARIRRLAAAGALALGPFYVLPDEFLIPPEATIRNLVLGRKVAARFGPVQPVGYVPDAFGHVAQMPQILHLAGVDSFIYTRGDADEIDELGLEWIWEAPDGTGVLAVHQCGGYCNAASLGHEEIWHAHTQRTIDTDLAVGKVRELFERMAAESNGDVWLLNNGCDHFPAQRDFDRVVAALEGAFPEVEFRHGSFSEFIDAVRAAGCAKKRWRGELRGGKRHHVLSGVWSARMPLKQRNDEAHTLLTDVCEPLTAFLRFRHGVACPRGLLEHAWKTLLENQPHDSICGCSIDSVHREMEPRFDQVLQTGDALVREGLTTLVPTFGTEAAGDRETVLGVFHPLPETRAAVVERLVVLQPFEGLDPEALCVEDEQGRRVPFEITARHRVRRFWGIDWRTVLDVETQQSRFDGYARDFGHGFLEPPAGTDLVDTFLRLRFLAELPPAGARRFRLVEDAEAEIPVLPEGERVHVDAAAGTLANGLVRVTLHPDGRFDLEDLRDGRGYAGLNALEDGEDVGDEYDHSPAAETRVVKARGTAGTLHVVDAGGLKGAVEARFVLPLPRRIAADRARRVAETVDCAVSVRLTLETGSPVVDVDVAFENEARDHRLVARFPTGIRTDTVVSDAHFLLARRPVDPPDDTGWCQPAPDTVPQQEFSLVSDGEHGLAVLVRGLPEVAALRADDRTIELRLTLLRAVGWLSRDDLPTRHRQNAGPTIATPDAQCLGTQRFRYAVLAFGGDALDADVKGASRRWRTPLPCVQGVLDGGAVGGEGLVSVATRRTSVSAIKAHEARETLVVRLTNLDAEPVRETLSFGLDLGAAWRVDLHEARVAPLDLTDPRTLRMTLRPHEILTVEVEPA